jgi:hypothetical protein
MFIEDKIPATHLAKEETMKKKVIIWTVAAIVLFGLLIQLIPLPGRGNNPPVLSEPKWDNPQSAALVKRACYDCHSNQTVWPWYSYVAPVSWLVYHDTMEGRSNLNFSEWNSPQLRSGEMIQAIQSGKMPPAVYLPMHPSAQLTSAEKQQLIQGLTNSLP